jgi:hypothetical protein
MFAILTTGGDDTPEAVGPFTDRAEAEAWIDSRSTFDAFYDIVELTPPNR